jgi:hypothetical protein
MENNKYLIVSMTDTHAELLQAIRNNARKSKVSVSQYVRTLLYNAIDLADESGKTPTRMDDTRTESTMGSGIWQSA